MLHLQVIIFYYIMNVSWNIFTLRQRCHSVLQGIQLELHSGCTQSDRTSLLHHAALPEQIKVTAAICKHILCDKQSALCSGIDA